jgi:hypothetical protein
MNSDTGDTFSAPLGHARDGRLELRRATKVAVRAGAIDGLCRASFKGAAPRTRTESGRVVLLYPRFSLASLRRPPSPRAEIELNAALPWSLAIAGGLGDSTLDLRAVDLRVLDVEGGARGVRVMLPRPRGRIRVAISGGASDVTFLRPTGVSAIVRVAGGASRIQFDGERYGAIGAGTRLETPAAGLQPDHYEIEIDGGATKLTVAEERALA